MYGAIKIQSQPIPSTPKPKVSTLTCINAATAAQVLNCVIYPRYSYDAPILGIDFLAFGKSKVLAILDFQPLKQDADYLEKYIDPLIPLRNKYEVGLNPKP